MNPKSNGGRRRKITWIIIIATLIILAGAAAGLAVNFLQKNKSSAQGSSAPIQSTPGTDSSTLIIQSKTGSGGSTFGSDSLSYVVAVVTTDGSTVYSTVTTAGVSASAVENSGGTITGTSAASAATITQGPTSSLSAPCANTLAYTSFVSWAGVASPINPSQVLWLYDLPDGRACCEQCWAMSPQKCNVWGYFPLGHPIDDKVSCALVYDYPGSQVDDSCPAGRPQVGILPAGPDHPYDASGNVGAPGPCIGLLYSVA
jgi:hypothetical protein